MAELIIRQICAATGCNENQVIEVIGMALEYLHKVAFCHEKNVTEAMMKCMWGFGGQACFHLGGILEEARIGTSNDIPWSEFILRFSPDLDKRYGPVVESWMSQRSEEQKKTGRPMMETQDNENIWLSRVVTVKKYREMEKDREQVGIADFIYQRLSERYILPVKTGEKNGFAIMACACLLIETLESFWNGWKTSEGAGPGEMVFSGFFRRTKRFREFEDQATSFYRNVRSGILHQGETKGGWRITRKRDLPILSVNRVKTIQAVKFLNRLDASLYDYCHDLKSADWMGERWTNARRKMHHIVSNCEERF